MSKSVEAVEQGFLIPPSELGNTEYVQSVSDLTPEMVEKLKGVRPHKLGIKCRRTDHKRNLHCYGTGKETPSVPQGSCIECGAVLVDWPRMWDRDAPVANKFAFLQTEWIRHFFFNVPTTPRIETYARKEGLMGLAAIAEHQLRDRRMLGSGASWWNRMQTPMLRGTIVHWARHAVACCCRECLNYWHNVPLERAMSDGDVEYFRGLTLEYIQLRLPDLAERGDGGGDADPHR